MADEVAHPADDVAVEQCDHRHPFNGSQCHKPRWHKGSHVAETPSLVMVWGFGYDEHSDGPGVPQGNGGSVDG